MSILVIVLAVCLVLGSMLWVLPSAKERQQMVLRRQAMRMGIQVQLSKLEDPSNPFEKIHCVAYRLPHRQVEKGAKSWLLYGKTITRNPEIGGWGFGARAPRPETRYLEGLKPLLARLPEDAIALELTPGAVSVYWREKGQSEDVETIFQVLESVQQL